jgi:hypothetical protein
VRIRWCGGRIRWRGGRIRPLHSNAPPPPRHGNTGHASTSSLLSLRRRSSEEVGYDHGSSGLEPSGCGSGLLHSLHGSSGSGAAAAVVAARGWARRARGWAQRAYPWAFFFFLFYLIYRGGHQTASKNALFTVTLCPRRLRCLPW